MHEVKIYSGIGTILYYREIVVDAENVLYTLLGTLPKLDTRKYRRIGRFFDFQNYLAVTRGQRRRVKAEFGRPEAVVTPVSNFNRF